MTEMMRRKKQGDENLHGGFSSVGEHPFFSTFFFPDDGITQVTLFCLKIKEERYSTMVLVFWIQGARFRQDDEAGGRSKGGAHISDSSISILFCVLLLFFVFSHRFS